MTPPTGSPGGDNVPQFASPECDEKTASKPKAAWNRLTSSFGQKRRKAESTVRDGPDGEDQPDAVNFAENGGNGGILSEAELERLGRERPACFPNIWVEMAFGFSVVMSQVLAVRWASSFCRARVAGARTDILCRNILSPDSMSLFLHWLWNSTSQRRPLCGQPVPSLWSLRPPYCSSDGYQI